MVTQDVWWKYKAGEDKAQQELILKYLPLVKSVAGRLAVRLPPWMSREDLESVGVLGLMEAIERFDPERGTNFEAYAYRRVRGAMLDEVRRLTWLSRGLWRRMRKVNMVREELETTNGRQPSNDELAEALGVAASKLTKTIEYFQALYPVSLEAINGSGENQFSLNSLVKDPSSPDPLELFSQGEDRRSLEEAITCFNEKLKLVLALYYQEGLTLKEIGRVLGVSESRVCQMHAKAIKNLRKMLCEEVVQELARCGII